MLKHTHFLLLIFFFIKLHMFPDTNFLHHTFVLQYSWGIGFRLPTDSKIYGCSCQGQHHNYLHRNHTYPPVNFRWVPGHLSWWTQGNFYVNSYCPVWLRENTKKKLYMFITGTHFPKYFWSLVGWLCWVRNRRQEEL